MNCDNFHISKLDYSDCTIEGKSKIDKTILDYKDSEKIILKFSIDELIICDADFDDSLVIAEDDQDDGSLDILTPGEGMK